MAEQGALLAKDTADTFMIAVYSYRLTMVKFDETGTILASSELDRDVNTFLLGKSLDVSSDSTKIFIAYATEENSGTIFFGSHNANDLTLIKTQKISVRCRKIDSDPFKFTVRNSLGPLEPPNTTKIKKMIYF